MIKMRLKDLLFSITLLAMPAAHSSDMINLPEPRLESDYSIEQAIHNRRSVREFSNKPLSSVFLDPLALTFDDPDHSIGEHRLLTFGRTKTQELVIVSHTETDGAIRIISVRHMKKHERNIYEEG